MQEVNSEIGAVPGLQVAASIPGSATQKNLSKRIKGALMSSVPGQNILLSRHTPMLCFPDFSSDVSVTFLSH